MCYIDLYKDRFRRSFKRHFGGSNHCQGGFSGGRSSVQKTCRNGAPCLETAKAHPSLQF